MACDTGSKRSGGAQSGFVWCLGVIGAAIHFIGNADGFWAGVLGFLKALVWPVFVVWKLLEFLKL